MTIEVTDNFSSFEDVLKEQLDVLKNEKEVLENVSNYIDSLIESDDKDKKKADLLCYWISDYTNFLKRENCFDPKRSKKYKRGDIIKVLNQYKQPKKKMINGEWIDTGEKEWWISDYVIC